DHPLHLGIVLDRAAAHHDGRRGLPRRAPQQRHPGHQHAHAPRGGPGQGRGLRVRLACGQGHRPARRCRRRRLLRPDVPVHLAVAGAGERDRLRLVRPRRRGDLGGHRRDPRRRRQEGPRPGARRARDDRLAGQDPERTQRPRGEEPV
ncbi:MAG: hypothetical protein AVDCRST_MAG48-2856, partial [uncultured Friedmanniella sp.]